MYTFVFSVTLILACSFLFPQEAISIVAELKRQLRLRVIRRTGTNGAKELADRLQRYASDSGIPSELVEEVLAEHHDKIVERLGKRYADEILGEADFTERCL